MSEISLATNAETACQAEVADSLPEIRCRRCRRLLMKGEIKQVEIKCPKCGCVQRLN